MRPGHTLAELTSRVVESVDRVLVDEKPDIVLVQGDTTTVFATSLTAFYRGIPVGQLRAQAQMTLTPTGTIDFWSEPLTELPRWGGGSCHEFKRQR